MENIKKSNYTEMIKFRGKRSGYQNAITGTSANCCIND